MVASGAVHVIVMLTGAVTLRESLRPLRHACNRRTGSVAASSRSPFEARRSGCSARGGRPHMHVMPVIFPSFRPALMRLCRV
jgi:hypothetical protein